MSAQQRRVAAAWLHHRQWAAAEDRARTEAAAFERERRLRRRKLIAALGVHLQDTERRMIKRNGGGWSESTINKYVIEGDEATYKFNFRCTKLQFRKLVQCMSESGHITDNKCFDEKKRMTAAFKIGVCMYFMAGHGRGDTKAVADAAGLGISTVEMYLDKYCDGIFHVLRPIYMPKKPPSAEHVERVRKAFAIRRGIPNVAMAVDGTHTPFNGGPEYRNYKGWEVWSSRATASRLPRGCLAVAS